MRVGITIVLELKNKPFARRAIAEQIVRTAKNAGHRPVFMALYNMAKIREKAAAVVKAGGQFAVIYGKRQFLRRLSRHAAKKWAVKPTWN